jgi:hypothetical protein
VVALSSLLPSLWLSTNYNFLYAVCTDDSSYNYRCGNYLEQRYAVIDGQLVINDIDLNQDSDGDGVADVDEGYSARLFLHDTASNETREISAEEAKTLNLNELLTSPDGVTVSNRYEKGVDFFLAFDNSSTYGYYLTKGDSKREMNLINVGNGYYRNNFQFIGWVLPGRN